MIFPHGLMQPLVDITENIGSTFPKRSYYHYIDIMITDYVWINLLNDLNLLFPSSSLTTEIGGEIGNLSIHNESILLEGSKHLTSYKFVLNQDY